MANTHTDLNSLFTAMADAIREKTNSSGKIVADNFPTEIENLRTGFDYSNHNVTAIPDYAFYGCEELTSVDCYNLTSIGESAFENCKNLKSVILYDGVETVGANAFKGCGEVEINCMFDQQPDGWDENWNPDGCEVVWLGGAIETWDVSATENDSVIAKLYNDAQNDGMCLLVLSGSGNTRDFFTKNGYTTTYNAPWPFLQIRAVIVCNGIANIGSHAFRERTNLTSVTIGNSVTSIGQYAFYNCKTLTSVNIPDSVTSIGYETFSYCDSLTSVTIGDSVTRTGGGVFRSCDSLTSVTIGNSVTSIDAGAFHYCSSLTSITIPDSVTSIGDSAFSGCSSLTSVTIPDSVTSIGDRAFEDCHNLTSVTIPESVTNIGSYVFYRCVIKTITYTGTIAQWNMISFESQWDDVSGDYIIYCTDGTITKYGKITYYTTT